MIHISHLHGTPLLARIGAHAVASPGSVAFGSPARAGEGVGVTYPQLCSAVLVLALGLISIQSRARELIGWSDLGGARVVILLADESGRGLGARTSGLLELAILGTLAAGGVAVPVLPPISDEAAVRLSLAEHLLEAGPGDTAQDQIKKSKSKGIILHDSANQPLAERLRATSPDDSWSLKDISGIILWGRMRGWARKRWSGGGLKRRNGRDLKLVHQDRGALALIRPGGHSNDPEGLRLELLSHAELAEQLHLRETPPSIMSEPELGASRPDGDDAVLEVLYRLSGVAQWGNLACFI